MRDVDAANSSQREHKKSDLSDHDDYLLKIDINRTLKKLKHSEFEEMVFRIKLPILK